MVLSKNKIFYIFLIINGILWTCIQFFRHCISIDAMEAIVWGELIDFGTNKHPPLSGWIMSGAYNMCGEHDFIAYILGQLSIIIGLIFTYKLAKFFLSEEKAICSSLIMTVCYYYTYTVCIDNFNPNFLSMAIIPAIAYFYYKAIKEAKAIDWILFGVICGLGVLNKYQIVFLFFAIFIHFILFERQQFRKKGMYLAILAGGAVIAPHVLWLIKNDFFSFAYMIDQASGMVEEEGPAVSDRIFFPIKFIADQIGSLVCCYVVYALLALYSKNISLGNKEGSKSDKVFLLSICFVPALSQGLMGFFTGNMVHGIWGSIMVSFAGVVMFYFLPIEFKKDEFNHFIKLLIITVILIACAITIFFQVQTKRQILYPYEENIEYLHNVWNEKTNNAPLKYVGGNIGYSTHFRVYDKTHPHVVLESFGHKNPWEDHEDILKSGIIVIAKTPEKLIYRTKDAVYLLPEDYEIEINEYHYNVKNNIGKTKEYFIYYSVIPPQQDSGVN
jgi:4-amino-4-deoxy-L-arabinose transferase-like glycosyltransferase